MTVYSGSRKGRKHAENEDAIAVRELPNGRLPLAVADGVSSHAYGGSAARWIVKHLVDDLLPERMGEYLAGLHRTFQDEFEDLDEMLHSGASLALTIITGNEADIYWAGDSPVLHTRLKPNCSTTLVAEPHLGPGGALTKCFVGSRDFLPSYRRIELHADDELTMASDGVIVDAPSLSDEATRGVSQAGIDTMLEESVAAAGSDDASLICYLHRNSAAHA